MDAVPGMPTRFWFIPTKSTQDMREITGNPKFNYELACTEVCGRGHFAMRFIVVVDEPEDFEAWKASQNAWSADNADYVNTIVPGSVKVADTIPATTDSSLALASSDTTAVSKADSVKSESKVQSTAKDKSVADTKKNKKKK